MLFLGRNFALLIPLMVIPGVPRLLVSDWVYHHRHWFSKVGWLGAWCDSLYYTFLSVLAEIRFLTAPAATMLDAIRTMKRVFTMVLEERMRDPALAISDAEGKQDIMSLLVLARMADLGKGNTIYSMSDNQVLDHMVRLIRIL